MDGNFEFQLKGNFRLFMRCRQWRTVWRVSRKNKPKMITKWKLIV